MNVEVFSLCDAATADNSGKLNVLGVFDTIVMQELPGLYPQCAVALRLRFKAVEHGDHKIELSVVDQDGRPVIPSLTGNLSVQAANGQTSVSTNAVLNIQRLKLDKDGEYSVDLAVDGREEASVPLYVRKHVPLAKAA